MIEPIQVKSDAEIEKDKAIETVKTEYEEKEKVKPLTDKERLDRIEKILGIS